MTTIWKYTNTNCRLLDRALLALLALIFMACGDGSNGKKFERLAPEETGVTFQNSLAETLRMNIFTYLYFYNGGGVAAGDLNGDGLSDLYFTANLESNKLYLNEGGFKFSDVTESSGVQGKKGWTTGVTMADVNGDGKLDIYVSQLGDFKHIGGKNQLYINRGNDENGIPLFEDQASQWGLDLIGFSTQAAFFDYDLDGDLDMFMLNHSTHSSGTFTNSSIRTKVHPLAGDKLMRNDGDKFTNVTEGSGIYSSALGYGLGVSISDVNWDGYPDIYVGNDFHEDDYLYMNNGDNTFKEVLGSAIRHTSRFSMGNDIGDINNDGWNDILSLDMLPADPAMLKSSEGEGSYDIYHLKLGYGYKYQFARNTLQLNLGNGRFSEVGLLSGVYATDWSWSGLVVDLDLDGLKDIYVSNGIKRRPNDLDYINFISNDAIKYRLEGDLTDEDLALVENMPVVEIPNFCFRNHGNLHFEDVSEDWGLDQASFSNGATYADLDNDGDLDLVVNNIDKPAFIYRNNSVSDNKRDHHFLKMRFQGDQLNTYGLGVKVIIPRERGRIVNELFTTRGYQSSVSPEMIIGLGESSVVDSVIVIWPDHRYEILLDVAADQTLEIDQRKAKGKYDFTIDVPSQVFKDVTDSLGLPFTHRENRYVEFNREALIPHMASTEGPCLAVGDVNGDGWDDFYSGGGKRQHGEVYLQSENGFTRVIPASIRQDSLNEDVDAAFVDVDQDGDLDLIVLSGGNEFRGRSESLLPRLYKNDGSGKFEKDKLAFQDIHLNASCLAVADYDRDGDQDLFIGGRVVPWNYGAIPPSFLLQNDGAGGFTDVTRQIAPDLVDVGMVKDARWGDIDSDGLLDLIVVGEWMPITPLINEGGKFSKTTPASLRYSEGWWNTFELVDFDKDGDLDIIAGNLGLNSKLKATKDQPVTMLIKDYDNNGQREPLLFYYNQGREQLFATKDELGSQLVEVKKRFVKYADFAQADAKDIVGDFRGADKLSAHEFRSGIYVNEGNMNFNFEEFPVQAQFSPINTIYLLDFDHDGWVDILSAGNFYEVNIQRGRYDADYGTLLKNNSGEFSWVPNFRSGLALEGQIRNIRKIRIKSEDYYLVARNNGPITVLKQ